MSSDWNCYARTAARGGRRCHALNIGGGPFCHECGATFKASEDRRRKEQPPARFSIPDPPGPDGTVTVERLLPTGRSRSVAWFRPALGADGTWRVVRQDSSGLAVARIVERGADVAAATLEAARSWADWLEGDTPL
jgi:hypothetical protein